MAKKILMVFISLLVSELLLFADISWVIPYIAEWINVPEPFEGICLFFSLISTIACCTPTFWACYRYIE
jgi:hypothetical protein